MPRIAHDRTWGDVLALVLGPLGGGALLLVAFPSVVLWALYTWYALTGGWTSMGSMVAGTGVASMGWLAVLLGTVVFTASAFLRWSRRGLLRVGALALVVCAAPVALFPHLVYAAAIVALLNGAPWHH